MSLIKDIDVSNRPREKMLREGIDRLSDEELIAIILRNGTKNNSVLDIARDLIKQYGGLNGLLNCDIYSLMKIKGIKKAKAITLLTILEITKRANKERIHFINSLNNASTVYNLVKDDLENEKQENFMVIYLNIKLHIIKKEILFKGYEWVCGLEVDGEGITKFNIVFALGILLQTLGSFCVLRMYKFGKAMYFFGVMIIVFWLFFGCLDFSLFGLSSFLLSNDITVGFTPVGWWIIAFEALLITYI